MIKRLTTIVFFALISATTFAQNTKSQAPARRRNQPRPYTLTVNDAAKSKVDTGKLGTAFRKVYPGFAVADGYRTKREVTMRIIDTVKDFTIKAVPGEIVANGKWLKNKKKPCQL